MQRATKTIRMIDKAIQKDQGSSYRRILRTIIPKMEDAYREDSDPYRNHLGASLIGRECARDIWYGFRWALASHHEGRLLRLFNRGHLEEARFIAMLLAAGFEMWYETEDGGQMRFSDVCGHFGSALDGVVKGIPDLPPGVPAYAEFKTSNDKKFDKLDKNGMKAEKYEHYVQMQTCMGKMGLQFGLYLVVNKNNDELYGEIIEFDPEEMNKTLYRATAIVFSDQPPPKINMSPGWWKCKICDRKEVCHGTTVPDVNCRTCVHSSPLQQPTPEGKGAWSCALGNPEITTCPQQGCESHVFNPYMLNRVQYHGGNAEENCTDLTLPTGDRILQGPSYVTSKQLKARGLK